MTRSWTDPRTGKRWHIDVVRQQSGHGPAPRRPGPSEASSAVVFDSREGSFSFPTEDATRLEALEDEKLAELLDLAKEASTPDADPQAEPDGQTRRDPGEQRRGTEP